MQRPREQAADAEERTWLPAARRGERWALERLYTLHQPRLFAFCYRLLGREADAQDAAQAAFVQAFRALPKFRGDCSARTWLYGIAMNKCRDAIRRRGSGPVALEADVAAPEAGMSVEERLAVRAAMARLSADHRAVLALRFWEGLAYEEMAEVLAVPVSTVRMRLKRAKDAFRRCYQPEG